MSNLQVDTLEYRKTIKRVTQAISNFFPLLMCLKDIEDKGIKKEKSEDMDKPTDCPLCLERFDLDDKKFFPCSCGYQVCRFCWHRIRTNENGLCPACRRIYPENPADFQPVSPEEMQKIKLQKKMKDIQKKQKIQENRKQLANIRVIQKNLVFAVGLPLELSQDIEKKEKILQMFRQFGPTLKETITDKTSYAGTQGPSSCIYITYQKSEDAVRAVKSLANTKIDGRIIKVSLGTTKYCSHFLKNSLCPKSECLYLHELADEEASFTKDEIHAGKHYEYEQKLLEQTLNITSQNKINTPNTENRTNHNQNVDNCSESSDEQNTSYSVQQNNSVCGSETSELSPTSNSQNMENIRNIVSDFQNEMVKNHQNMYSNPDLMDSIEGSPQQVFRSEERLMNSVNHSVNSTFQNTSLNTNAFNNQTLQKDIESLPPQPNFMSNQMYESALQCRGQSSSALQRFITSSSSSSLVNDNGIKNSVPEVYMMNQEHGKTKSDIRDDDPDLEFDPCQESLNALQALMISEDNEKAKLQYQLNRNPSVTNHRSTMPPLEPFEVIGYKNAVSQSMKLRDPPPGFSNNCTQNIPFKPSYESGFNKTYALHNQLGIRTNFNAPRFTPPAIPSNNSYLPDYTSTLSREIPDIIPVQHQQHNHQRVLNFPQIPYPVTEQRSSPLWNNTSQSQWRPMENSFFNHTSAENRVPNEFSVRMPIRSNELPMRSNELQMRSNELTMRQWQQQLPGNVNNLSPFQDHSQMSEQNAKLQAMFKSVETARNSPSFTHRLQYTKKL